MHPIEVSGPVATGKGALKKDADPKMLAARRRLPVPYTILHSDRDLQSMLQRVAAEELDAAVDRLSAVQVGPGDVHDVRKRVKKLRGLLRLLRSGLPVFARENAALRTAAAHLSAQRDADVRVATFDRIMEQAEPARSGALRALLASPAGPAGADPVPFARAALAIVRVRSTSWKIDGSDRDVLQDGLARTRRQARRAMAEAAANPTAHAMHEWRKRVKDGWYQARLLTPIRPDVLQPNVEQAGLLGEDLGEHHDLAVLADHLSALPDGAVTPPERDAVLARIRAAQDLLEARAFASGAALLADKPREMARRWTGWWKDWRG
jgi:CHAD domain-containing protein